ncbi:MAG: hypothetical protein NVSMB53_14230 [Gemmatimonadaceae bacterium]
MQFFDDVKLDRADDLAAPNAISKSVEQLLRLSSSRNAEFCITQVVPETDIEIESTRLRDLGAEIPPTAPQIHIEMVGDLPNALCSAAGEYKASEASNLQIARLLQRSHAERVAKDGGTAGVNADADRPRIRRAH